MRMAITLEQAARMVRARTLTEERAREIISDMLADVYGGEGLRSFTTGSGSSTLPRSKPTAGIQRRRTNTSR